jgi:peptidoglycan hydrolase CwlO-like protein
MFKLFKRKEKFNATLYDLQLKIENQQGQLDELREMILQISRQVNSIQIEIDYLVNNRYGKSI